MRIIVCGAGSVGRSIVSYLARGNNDIAVIDNNQRKLDEIAQEFDILPILGEASHPDILEKAGAEHVDLLLAVTNKDEVNMIACQVAHSLFQVPVKIARLDSNSFLDPVRETMYSDNHLPIDLVISPDIKIAQAILNILKYPGSSGIISVLKEEAVIVTLKIKSNCPLIKIPLMQLPKINEDLNVAVIDITRDGSCFIPESYDVLEIGDEINVLVKRNEVENVIRGFGLDNPSNERLVIFGGNSIARYIGTRIEHDDTVVSCKIIEENLEDARRLARDLSHVVVIHGPMMSDLILDEANIRHADASIAVTGNDKDNLLASLLSEKSGVSANISVVNSPSYNNLIFNIENNILVDRGSITISQILKEVRKVKMNNAYSISRGCGEIWEIPVKKDSICAGKKIGELNLHKMSRIFAIQREDELIYPDKLTEISEGDTLLFYVNSQVIKQAEKIF